MKSKSVLSRVLPPIFLGLVLFSVIGGSFEHPMPDIVAVSVVNPTPAGVASYGVSQSFSTSLEYDGVEHYFDQSHTATATFTLISNMTHTNVSVSFGNIGPGSETFGARFYVRDTDNQLLDEYEIPPATTVEVPYNLTNHVFVLWMNYSYYYQYCTSVGGSYCLGFDFRTDTGCASTAIMGMRPHPPIIRHDVYEDPFDDTWEHDFHSYTDENLNLYGVNYRGQTYIAWQEGNITTQAGFNSSTFWKTHDFAAFGEFSIHEYVNWNGWNLQNEIGKDLFTFGFYYENDYGRSDYCLVSINMGGPDRGVGFATWWMLLAGVGGYVLYSIRKRFRTASFS